MTKLPISWTSIALGEVGSWRGGGTPSKDVREFWADGKVPWVSPKDMKTVRIRDSEDHITDRAIDQSAAKRVAEGSVLVVTRSGILAHTLPVAVTDVEVTVNQDLKALTPNEAVDPDFVAWALRAFGSDILEKCKKDGTTVASIEVEALFRYQVPLAPRKEQRRIVDAIDSHLTRLDDAVASLEGIQAKLKAYRASVLKSAVEGRLVPTEAFLARAETRDYEPAEVLLARILQERRRCWEVTQLAKFKASGKSPEKDKWKGEYREPTTLDTSKLMALPEGWCWATVEQLALLVTDGDHNPPRRVSTGVPHLTAKHIKKGRILFDDCSFVSAEGFAKTRARYEPREGDVIITCVGTIGETAVVPPRCVFSADRNLAAIRLVSGFVRPAFVMYVLSSPDIRKLVMSSSGATAQPHFYLGDLRMLALPIPPKAEQDRIVGEIERLLSIADESDALVVMDIKRSARLRQSILIWAFAGMLVDQDPTDEPAEKLLARMRAERASIAPDKNGRGRKAKGAA